MDRAAGCRWAAGTPCNSVCVCLSVQPGACVPVCAGVCMRAHMCASPHVCALCVCPHVCVLCVRARVCESACACLCARVFVSTCVCWRGRARVRVPACSCRCVRAPVCVPACVCPRVRARVRVPEPVCHGAGPRLRVRCPRPGFETCALLSGLRTGSVAALRTGPRVRGVGRRARCQTHRAVPGLLPRSCVACSHLYASFLKV